MDSVDQRSTSEEPPSERPSTSELLRSLSEWERADEALPENATVGEEFAADVEMEIERRLTVEESRTTDWIPASTYERWTRERVSLEDRYSEAPDDVSEKTIEFVEMGQSTRECPHCEGASVETCTRCNGEGTTHSDYCE